MLLQAQKSSSLWPFPSFEALQFASLLDVMSYESACLQRLAKSGAYLVSSEMALFQLCGDAKVSASRF